MERRLAAVIFVDIVGDTALVAQSEAKGRALALEEGRTGDGELRLQIGMHVGDFVVQGEEPFAASGFRTSSAGLRTRGPAPA